MALVMLCLASMCIATLSPAAATNLADLTARPPVRIGNPAHTPIPAGVWGGTIKLTDQDAVTRNQGKCTFNIWYELVNKGTAVAQPAFVDTIKVGLAPVSVSPPIAPLPAGESRLIKTQAVLPGGAHTLSLDIDSGGVVTESNKANNHLHLNYTLVGNCAD
jgi:hypothetical protein